MWRRSLPFLVIAVPALAGEPKPTRISWRFENIVDGFDHMHQMVVEADGAQVGTSEAMNESDPGSMSLTLPSGASSLRMVDMALYEGIWEEHTVDNDYSVDCVWDLDLKARPPKKVDLVCDIDEGPKVRMK